MDLDAWAIRSSGVERERGPHRQSRGTRYVTSVDVGASRPPGGRHGKEYSQSRPDNGDFGSPPQPRQANWSMKESTDPSSSHMRLRADRVVRRSATAAA